MRSSPLVLDRDLRQLRRGDHVLPVSGLPLRILELLISAQGKVVTRDELKARLWPYAVRIDVDRRLNTAVRALRKAIEEDAPNCGRIVTVRGYGYRWVPQQPNRPARVPYLALAATIALVATFGLFNPVREAGPQPLASAQATVRAADSKLSATWDWRGAETLYQKALAVQPGLREAHRGLAWLYVNEGRRADALPHIARLLEEPDSTPARRAELGWLLMRAGKPDAALAICSKPDERTMNLLSCRHTALSELGLVELARQTAADLMQVAEADPAAIRSVSGGPAAEGYANFLRWRTDHFVKPEQDWFQRAQLQAEAGMYAKALDSLEIAVARHDPLLVKIRSTSAFAKLHSSARFQRIEKLVLRGSPKVA